MRKNIARATSSGPSTKSHTHVNHHTIIIPANNAVMPTQEVVLTKFLLIEPILALCNFAKQDPTAKIPTASEMTEYLTDYNAQTSTTKPATTSSINGLDNLITAREPMSPVLTNDLHLSNGVGSDHQNDHDDHPSDVESEVQDNEMQESAGVGKVATPASSKKTNNQIDEPQTPVAPQNSQVRESRGWLSGVSELFKTPIKFFGRRIEKPQNSTPNGVSAEDGTSSRESTPSKMSSSNNTMEHSPAIQHLIPQTSDFAIPPFTPSNQRKRRNLIPQTERKAGILIQQPKTGPKTERHVRFKETTPLHLRGILSEERKREIWRRQDEDRNLKMRQDRRAMMHARAESEDKQDSDENTGLPHAGMKRKVRNPESFPPDFNFEGHFEVPDSSSDEEDEADINTSSNEMDLDQPWVSKELPLSAMKYNDLSRVTFQIKRDEFIKVWHDMPINERREVYERLPQFLQEKISQWVEIPPQISSPSLLRSRTTAPVKQKPFWELPISQIAYQLRAMDDTEYANTVDAIPQDRRLEIYDKLTVLMKKRWREIMAAADIPFTPPVSKPIFEAGQDRTVAGALARHRAQYNTPVRPSEETRSQDNAASLRRQLAALEDQLVASRADSFTPSHSTISIENKIRAVKKRITEMQQDEIFTQNSSAPSPSLFNGTKTTEQDQLFGAIATPKQHPTNNVNQSISATDNNGFSPNHSPTKVSDTSSAYQAEDDENVFAAADNARENASGTATVLQSKTWTQSPPPKPKPSNAQLPQPPIPTAGDLAKARAEKHKPTRPSGLRNVTQMSPLQLGDLHKDKEAAALLASLNKANHGLEDHGFNEDVLNALSHTPLDAHLQRHTPDFLYQDFDRDFDPEVMALVRAHLG